MNQDSELPLAQLKVDGGMTANDLVLQLQADILGITVGEFSMAAARHRFWRNNIATHLPPPFPLILVRPDLSEMTVLGAAIAAGTAANVWKDVNQLPKQDTKTFESSITSDGASPCNFCCATSL